MRILKFSRRNIAIAFDLEETETILADDHGPDIIVPGKPEWRIELLLETTRTIASIEPKPCGPVFCFCGIHEEWLRHALKPGRLQAVQFDHGRYSIRLGFNLSAADLINVMGEPTEIIPAELTLSE